MPFGGDRKVIRAWLEEHLEKGQTKRNEALALLNRFGRGDDKLPEDLDRPKRDNVVTCQYRLWYHDPANWCFLILHFDATTDLLIDHELSESVCGFCPHVFAYDGRWRLEGKMLAGCVGKAREGCDVLVLPRLTTRDCRVKIANLAPEVDHITRAELVGIPLLAREELDVDTHGNPVAWVPLREHEVRLRPALQGRLTATIAVRSQPRPDVVVVEVRNTSAFEAAMRERFLRGRPEHRRTGLVVDFGSGRTETVTPVGTKFLRRVVVSAPKVTSQITLIADGGFWSIRRLWTGARRQCQPAPAWVKPCNVERLRLMPGEEAALEFRLDSPKSDGGRVAYALRIQGHYDFVSAQNLPR